jgi:hypothetical protein
MSYAKVNYIVLFILRLFKFANESRDWRIFADFTHVMIPDARTLYKTDNTFNVDIDNMVYALDFSSIEQ